MKKIELNKIFIPFLLTCITGLLVVINHNHNKANERIYTEMKEIKESVTKYQLEALKKESIQDYSITINTRGITEIKKQIELCKK